MKIAIINCKASKQDYECSVREMYEPSALFRAQVEFIEKHYDHWLLISSKYGVLHPDNVIKPYNLTMKKKPQNPGAHNLLSNEEREGWAVDTYFSLPKTRDVIDFYIGLDYYEPMKHLIIQHSNWTHISQPRSVGGCVSRYREAYASDVLDPTIISENRPSPFPDVLRNWYHPDGHEFYGNSEHLAKAFPQYKLDLGTIHRVGKIGYHLEAKHCKGWVCDPELLPLLYKNKKDSWRLHKNVPTLEGLM